MTLLNTKELRHVLRTRGAGILAPVSGGCSRYIFSTRTDYSLDAHGQLILAYESPNPYHHQLMANTGMSLQIDYEKNDDGSDRSHLVLIGHLKPLETVNENKRMYRFDIQRAHVALESGETIPTNVAALL